jgi:hypothetical protein
VGDRTQLASKVMLEVIRRKAAGRETLIEYTPREKQLFEYLGGHDSITLKEFCRLGRTPRPQAQEILVNLAAVGLLRINSEGPEETYSLAARG